MTQYGTLPLNVWYTFQYAIEKYPLTIFSLIWFGTTILANYIILSIIAVSIIGDIAINKTIETGNIVIHSRYFTAFAIFTSSIITAWKYSQDHNDLLFSNFYFLKGIYSAINSHHILFSAATVSSNSCLQLNEFVHIEKILLYTAFGFQGIPVFWPKRTNFAL